MIQIKPYLISDNNHKIIYKYDIKSIYKKYFKEQFYIDFKEDISDIPSSIMNIPIITNLAVICWFIGSELKIDEIDENLYLSLLEIQKEYKKMYPQITSKNIIDPGKIIRNEEIEMTSAMMLFSGGVDAFATYFRHIEEHPFLVKVFGDKLDTKDIKTAIEDEIYLNDSENSLANNSKKYIVSNLRTFYSNNLNNLISQGGWWSHVQHGYGLTTLLAPLTFKYKIANVYIASSYTDKIKIAWGSTPEVDNKIKWANSRVIHDGYDLLRQDKVDLISDYTKTWADGVKLRVCYSPLNKYTNCSKCEKCQRTIIALILNNVNPNKYGFKVGREIYNEIIFFIKKGFVSEGVLYFWKEIHYKINDNCLEKGIFIFENRKVEEDSLNELKVVLQNQIFKGVKQTSNQDKIKHLLIRMFPNLFQKYLKLRFSLLKNKL